MSASDRAEHRSVFVVDRGGYQATNSHDQAIGVIYFVGIIDILQPYNAVKLIE
jgi:1-phosphatidylinositol-4-phosphate 5-kinase